MPLTDAACRAAKPGPVRRKLADGGGLQLWVQPSGSRLWQLAYRYRGKQRQLALGPYPSVTLLEAREKREAAKKQLRAGIDPGVAVRLLKAENEAQPDTFKSVALQFVEKAKREGKAKATIVKKEWLLEFAYPKLGELSIRNIRPIDVLGVLQEPESKGCYETARRLRATIGAVCRYAIATARADSDPTSALKGAITAPTVTPRAAITEAKKFGGLLRAIDGYDGYPTTHAALKLMALLFPRPGELRAAEWSEFDLDNAVWAVPAARTKMRREQRIPLSRQAVEILRELHRVTGHRKLAFPGLGSALKPISENTLNGALRRLGYGQTEASAHGFRASASTLLNETGKWSSDAIERQLGHIDNNGVRRAYARGEYWDERVRMMSWWADHLDRLKTEGAVVPFKRAQKR
jgi:integrase